jgi:diadenosine tetraphosphate (Ap4A) HIT family hydrolase
MSGFELHPRLAADTHFLADWRLCRVLLMNDMRYPWLILVPMREELVELSDLACLDRVQAMEEIVSAGAVVTKMLARAKLNVGSLGNLVAQLHIHVVGRRPGDPAWPGPVWGHSPAVPYDKAGLDQWFDIVRRC